MARWRIELDGDVCGGSGLCVGTAPEHFEAGPDGSSLPRRLVVDADEAVLQAAECCPMEAITIFDAGTGAVVAPCSQEAESW